MDRQPDRQIDRYIHMHINVCIGISREREREQTKHPSRNRLGLLKKGAPAAEGHVSYSQYSGY